MATPERYIPSDAVVARMTAIKEERRLAAAAADAAFAKAVEEGKIEWEVEILLGLEEGRMPPREIMLLPLEIWPEHDMMENVRIWGAQKDQERFGREIGFKFPIVSWNQPGYKRYMSVLSGGHSMMPYAHIRPGTYATVLRDSTVLNDTLNLEKALDHIQAGLPPEAVDAGMIPGRSVVKERAKFRIDLLRRLYPTLQIR